MVKAHVSLVGTLGFVPRMLMFREEGSPGCNDSEKKKRKKEDNLEIITCQKKLYTTHLLVYSINNNI